MIKLRQLLNPVRVVLVVLICISARAQTLNTTAAHLKVKRADVVWRIGADASSVFEEAVEREALSDQGAQLSTKYTQTYNKTLQRFEVLEAYTLKPDGRKIPVGKEGLQTQSGIATAGTGVSWPDAEVVQITFSDVQKGDRTGWRFRITQHTPELPGWARLQANLPPLLSYEQVSIRIEAPQSIELNVVASGLTLKQSMSGTNSVWEARGTVDATVLDDQPFNSLSTFPRVLASTFKTSEQLVTAYARESNARAVVTEAARKLALKITTGRTTPLDKATAVHDWVRKNIRYVAVYLGTGGWVPHDVDWILRNGYGDCKDHVLLMQTLLKAVDIEAVPTLINTTNEYVLAELPVGFNHCIVYLPALGIFADPTDGRIPFGALPWADAGKPVAVALNGVGKIMHTPAFSPDTNRIIVNTRLTIDKNGKSAGTVDIGTTGMAATSLQDVLAQFPMGMNRTAVQKLLEADHWRGRGTGEFPPIQRDTQTQTFRIPDLEIDNLMNDPASGSINPHPKLLLPVYIMRHLGNYAAPKRDFAAGCSPIFIREESELIFDPAFQLLRVPEDTKEWSADGIEFEARYERRGNTIRGWREIKLSHGRQICTREQYAARKPTMDRILRHLRSGILFQQNNP